MAKDHLRQPDHQIFGPYTLKAWRLTYRTSGARHAQDAKAARDAKREFAVSALNEHREFKGKVVSVELVTGERSTWEIVMHVLKD